MNAIVLSQAIDLSGWTMELTMVVPTVDLPVLLSSHWQHGEIYEHLDPCS